MVRKGLVLQRRVKKGLGAELINRSTASLGSLAQSDAPTTTPTILERFQPRCGGDPHLDIDLFRYLFSLLVPFPSPYPPATSYPCVRLTNLSACRCDKSLVITTSGLYPQPSEHSPLD
jgi:hypothetical protein